MKKYDVIFIALARWDGPYSSTAYSIAYEWSNTHRIFYIDNPFTIIDFIRNFFKPMIKKRWKALLFGNPVIRTSEENKMIFICPPLIMPINWLPEGSLYNFLSHLNNRIFFHAIKRVLRIYKIKNYIIFNSFNPFYRPFHINNINPELIIYQSVDNIEQSIYIQKHGPRLERHYVKEANLTITTSSELKRKLSKYSDNVFLIPNAANFDLFNRALEEDMEIPEDFPVSKFPVICYTGNICNRINYNLLHRIAYEKKNYSLLLIGPKSVNSLEFEKILELANVYYLGKKNIEELPAYLKYADCAIIPFKINDLTKSIYPLKINEYLAAGKPVITTKFSWDIQSFSDVIHIAEDSDQFLHLIDKVNYSENNAIVEKRINIARNNTWKNRVDLLEKIIAQNSY